MDSEGKIQHSSCTGKVRHETFNQAKGYSDKLRAEAHSNNYGVYKCRSCGGWHVGRKDKKLIRSAISHTTNRKKQDFFKFLLGKDN